MKTIESTNRGALCHRLSVIGIPPYLIPQFVDIWSGWVTHNGPEWAVKRFKSLKVDLIRQHSGLPVITRYVRKNRKGDYFGAIGALFRWSERGAKNFARALQAFCIYTSVTSEVETKSQLEKFMGAVSCQTTTGLDLAFFDKLAGSLHVIPSHLCEIVRGNNRLIEYRGSPEKFAPLPHNLGSTTQNKKVLWDLSWLRNMKNVAFAYLRYGDLYGPVFEGIGNVTRYHHIDEVDRTSYAGEVHFIQEPGYKLRAVASPYRIHQLALKPLGDALGKIVQTLPWDCTFDQTRALPIIQDRLKSNCTVHSVDLSNATDFFPLDIQVFILQCLFGTGCTDIRLFRDISRMSWKSAHGDIVWGRGQPLGLYPSFFAFTLTHGLVLHSLSERDGDFLVVGDDVVIFDDTLYERYLDFLQKTSCPYSSEKSLSSCCVAEFAGKVVIPDRVIPQLKWRKMSNDSFLDLAVLLGPRSRILMTDRQRRVFDLVRDLLPPVGLNMSTKGSNFLDSFRRTEEFLAQGEQTLVRSLTGLIRTIWHNAEDDPSGSVLNADTRTFDEKVLQVFRKTVFSHYQWLDHVAELPQALGLEPRLPIEAYPSRLSTLSRYERILSRVAK